MPLMSNTGKKKKGKAPRTMPGLKLNEMVDAHNNVDNLGNEHGFHNKMIFNMDLVEEIGIGEGGPWIPPMAPDTNVSLLLKSKAGNFPARKPASSAGKKEPHPPFGLTLNRTELFDKFGVKDKYPVWELKQIKSTIEKPAGDVHLHMPGIEQLSDVVFYMLYVLNEKKPYQNVKCLNITGCLNVTDFGLKYVAKAFPKLTEICLKGCSNITEAGLYHVVTLCTDLKQVNLRGTNVSILPKRVADMQITIDGFPCISPEKDLMEKQGLKIMKASLYQKPTDKDIVKVCVVQPSDSTTSLVKHISKKQEKSYRPMAVLSKFSLTDRFTVNVIECDEVFSDLFVTKRTLFVLTVGPKEDAKAASKRLFGLICHILNKVHYAGFLLVGLKSDSEKTDIDAVRNFVAASAANKSTALNKMLQEEQKTMQSGKGVGKVEQEMFMKRLLLRKALKHIYVEAVEADTTKSFQNVDALCKSLEAGLDKVCQLCPEVQELAGPMFKFLLSDSSNRSLKDGAVSMHSSKPSMAKIMELMELMGSAVCMSIIKEYRVVCLVDWLARVVNQALTIPAGSKTEDKVLGVAPDTPMYVLDDLKTELGKIMPADQAGSATLLLVRLGLSVSPSTFISYRDLPSEPTQSLENYFPEIPPTLKKQDLFYTVGYKAQLDTPLPSLLIHRMLFLCTKSRRPSYIWKSGFIILEGCVETLYMLDPADSCAVYLYSHTVKSHQGVVQERKLQELVWNTVLAHKVTFDYVLKEMNVPHQLSLVTGKQLGQEVKVTGLISGHTFVELVDDTNATVGPSVCQICNETQSVASLPWTLHGALDKPYLQEDMIVIDKTDNVRRCGNVLTFKNEAQVAVMSVLSPSYQPELKIGLLTEDTKHLHIGLGYSFVEKTKSFAGGLVIDLQTGVFADLISKQEIQKVPKEKIPKMGETITFQCCDKENSVKDVELKVIRDTEIILSLNIPKKNYQPVIQSSAAKDKYSAAVMLHPLYSTSSTHGGSEIEPEMRLEALDRKNPNLICCATVVKIMDNGQLLIHFDGWGNNYDYMADPASPDLHPVGWMETNNKLYPRLNSVLQKPHKYYKRTFTWENYCEENKFLPIPFDWFNEAQVGKATRERYDSVMETLGLASQWSSGGSFHASCGQLKNRPKLLERQVLKKCLTSKDTFEFFTKHTKFFCLLPQSLDVHSLRNSSLQSIMDFSKQNVHVLCSGIKTEVLHFVDYTGTPLPTTINISDMASYLQSCFVGLLLQENVLPARCSKLIPDVEAAQQGHLELYLQRMAFSYVCVLELHASASPRSNRVAMDVFGGVLKDKEAMALFTEKEPSPLCTGHAGSFMANNELRDIPLEQFSQFYHFMTKLDFQNNRLEKLPEDFFRKFKQLEMLNLANNHLENLPEGIKNLNQLMQVDLSGNKITQLPTDLDGVKSSLVSLNISDNPLKCLPKQVYKLECLEELFAENIGTIEDLFEITNLKHLEVLVLGKNCIPEIPDDLGDLPLTTLDLSGVPWFPFTQYQSFRAFMQALIANNVTATMTEAEMYDLFRKSDVDESSSLTPNELLDLNYNIMFPKYPRLGTGKLSYEKTGGVPPCIFKLTKLKKLVLRHHGLVSIPDDIKLLTELSELDISFNPKLLTLSAELGGCPIKQLHLRENVVLNTPPKEIVSRGVVAIIGYLKRLKLGSSPCKRTKLMMVGLGGAGKTSLVGSLMNAKYRAYMNQDEPITDGIDITNWNIPLDQAKDDVLTFSVWDFAGQTVYYNTHQFFLSNRAVYMLLWNVRQGHEHAGLDFWLSSIACHAPKAPILIIGTHVDKVEKFHLPEDSLKSRYPQISGFFYVSSYTGNGIPELKEALIKLTLEQKYMGERIPEAWLTLEKRLIKYREEKTVDILPYKSLDKISHECGIFDSTELVQAVEFLHDLGAVQFFNKDFLRDMVVIYPQWIVDVMACLVTVHEGAVKEGKLMLKDVPTVWKDYPADLHPWLLRLTEEFDLTCPLGDEDASIVPCLLPDTEPEYEWPHAKPEKNIHESVTVYKFQYLPAGLFNRAQVRLHQYSKGSLLWKKGSYMKKNGHICLMLQTDNQEVVVRAQGFRPDNFLFLVHEMIETLIIESYTGVHYDFLIPCMDCLSMNVKDPSMVSHIKVQRALELNVPFLQCEKFFHILSIQELRDAMPSDKMSDMDNHLRNSVRELIDLTQEATISVFFVFSSKNQPSLGSPQDIIYPGTILEDLRKQENFKVYYSDKPESSDMEALSLSMKAANVTVIGMSDEFCQDPECKRLLLYAKDVLRRPVLLVLLGKTKNWQKTDINLSVGTEVYVDMTNKDRYPHKIKELYEALKKKAAVKQKNKDEIPKCFISYCWSNSHDAVSKGSREQEGALGWEGGDPRKVKEFLEEKGVKCWLDVERVGGTGLFHSIADGLREAEVLIAFVSNEYVKSRNCVMEFRYGLTTLRIPVIIVVVGTGYEWERSEVGLLTVGHKCLKINLQYENNAGYLELLKYVQDKMPTTDDSQQSSENVENQRNIAFQEVLELTQRKFLRHMYSTIVSDSAEPYPCLIFVDFLTVKEKEKISTKRRQALEREKTMMAEQTQEGEGEKTDKEDVNNPETAEEEEAFEKKSKHCFRILCENPQGWHITDCYVPFPEMDPSDEQQLIDNSAPYLSRVYAIAKHSNIQLECLTTPEGEIFQQRVEEIGIKSASDFKEEYEELRNHVMQQDKGQVKNSLHRIQVSGKMVWLCDDHKLASRSKTEKRYEGQLTASSSAIPLPQDAPENQAMPPPQEPEVKSQPTARTQRKVFKRTSSQMKKPTSQACSVM